MLIITGKQSTSDKDAESLGLSWQTIQGLLSQADNQQPVDENAEPTWQVINKPLLPRIAHVKHKPNAAGLRSCRQCDAQFDTLEGLAKHVKEHLRASVQGSKLKAKEEAAQPKRKRGRPRKKKKVEEDETIGKDEDENSIRVRAPYVAGLAAKPHIPQHMSVGKRTRVKDRAIRIVDITQNPDNPSENADANEISTPVLNITGEGYSIVVKGNDATTNPVENISKDADGTVDQQGLADLVSSELSESPKIRKAQSQKYSKVIPAEIGNAETSSGEIVSPTKRRRLAESPPQPSRRGRRGELTKNCIMILDDNKWVMYKCKHCSLSFAKLELFGRHMTEVHEPNKCSNCQLVCQNQEELSTHTCVIAAEKIDAKPVYVEPEESDSENIGQEDVELDNTESENIEPENIELDDTLQGNSQTAQNDLNPSEGEGEGEAITAGQKDTENNQEQQKDDEEQQVFNCHICSKGFEKIKYLKRHLQGHSNEFLCQKCGRRFVRKETLQKHTCIQDQRTMQHESEHMYYCEFCGVSFAKQSYLIRHMATHTGEFRCKHCDRIFSRKESLLQHIKKYHPAFMQSSGEKVYPCEHCHRVFSREVTLQNHMKLHTNSYHCQQCGRSFSSVFTLEKHTCGVVVTVKDGFQCQQCKKVFQSESSAQQHLAVHSEGDLSCSFCNSVFIQRSALNQHMVVCAAALQGGDSFQCTVCDASFPDAGSFRNHYKQHSHPYQCDKCEKLFIRVSNLRRHKCTPVDNSGESVSCEICNRKFSHERFLQRHMSMHNPPKYQCETCNQKFTRIDFYNCHMCISETGERVQVQRNVKKDDLFGLTHAICPICGKSYSSVSNLNKHLKTHGEKNETCDVCGKRFHLKISLREHMQSVHTEEYKHQCQYCGKAMKCRNSLFGHVRQFHSDTIIMYECEQCGKQFRQKGNLKKHVLTHSSKKTFECQNCDKKFKFPDQLKRHEIWHTHGERFVCEFCSKKFVMQFELRKHLARYHSGVMYVCEYCSTECRHSHTMKRHLQHRHPDEPGWQVSPGEYIRGLIPRMRMKAAEEISVQIEEGGGEEAVGEVVVVQGGLGEEGVELGEEGTVVTIKQPGVDETEEGNTLLDNAMLAAQLQAQMQDPSLPLDGQPFIVAEVSGLSGMADPDATQTVIIQTTGQQFDNDLMSQEVAAALQSLSKQGNIGDNTLTIIQNMPMDGGEQCQLQVPENIAGTAVTDQPFIILPMATEGGSTIEATAAFETTQITTVPDGV